MGDRQHKNWVKSQGFWGNLLGKVLGKNFKKVIKTGTLRLPFLLNPETGLHVFDDRVTKL